MPDNAHRHGSQTPTHSSQPRKQRKAMHNAPHHRLRKQMASHLSEELLLKYNRRSLTLIKGDEVRVLRGDFSGKTGKVIGVDTPQRTVTVDGVVNKKADGTEVARPIHPSNLLIIRLNLEDNRRRDKLAEAEESTKMGRSEKPAKQPSNKGKPAPKAERAEAKPEAAKPRAEPKKTEQPIAVAATGGSKQ
jgi:large subunit ribosomal protein L24